MEKRIIKNTYDFRYHINEEIDGLILVGLNIFPVTEKTKEDPGHPTLKGIYLLIKIKKKEIFFLLSITDAINLNCLN